MCRRARLRERRLWAHHHFPMKNKVLTNERLKVYMDEQSSDLKIIVPAVGLEPTAFRFGGEHSNPLSYAGTSAMQEKIA